MKDEGNVAVDILLFVFILIIIIAILASLGFTLPSLITLAKKFLGLRILGGL